MDNTDEFNAGNITREHLDNKGTIIQPFKAIHIHTDKKFLRDSVKFISDYFENKVFLISYDREVENTHNQNITIVKPNPKSFKRIVDICNEADLVVLYGLDNLKARIALKLSENVKIAWRFFGFELYSIDSDLYFSERTRQVLKTNAKEKTVSFLKNIIRKTGSFIKWGVYPNNSFNKAIKRMDLFLGLMEEEYDMLSKRWNDLPPFIRIPIKFPFKLEDEIHKKKNHIIIGNNRSSYNNLLDVMDIIEQNRNKEEYKFLVLFNYGNESKYSKEVRQMVSNRDHYELITDFLSMDKFKQLYRHTSAAVFNGYRQMAMGNIFYAINYGVKVYLNDNNSVKDWLINNGIKVFSVDDFYADIFNNTIALTYKEIENNYEKLHRLINSYTYENFQLFVYKFLAYEHYET